MKIVREHISESIKHLPGRTEQELQAAIKGLPPQEKLETGAKQGMTWLVKDAIAAGANVHANNDYSLQWASRYGHAGVVKLLLDAGANVHADGDCALRWASNYGHAEVVKLLLGARADVHARDDCALRWASGDGHAEVVKLLLGAGADAHADNNLALQWASYNGHAEVVKVLLDAGADVHARDDYSLRWASYNGHAEVVKTLLDAGADAHADNDYSLRWASCNGHAEVVKTLLDAGADAHADNNWALQWASRNGHAEVVKLLKQHGAKHKSVNEAIKHLPGRTEQELQAIMKNLPSEEKFILGCKQGIIWLVDKVIEEEKLAINNLSNLYEYYIYEAIYLAHIALVKHLIEKHGLDIHKYDEKALRYAIWNFETFRFDEYEKIDLAKYLLSIGADFDAAYDFTKRNNYIEQYISMQTFDKKINN